MGDGADDATDRAIEEMIDGPTCTHCGEPATHKAPYSDQDICMECDDKLYGEPSGDSHPMGGMGYAISYTEELARSRRLK